VTSTANIFGGGVRYQYHLHIHEDDEPKLPQLASEKIKSSNLHYTELEDDDYINTSRQIVFKDSHMDGIKTIDLKSYMLDQFRENKSDFKPAIKVDGDMVWNYGSFDFHQYVKQKKEKKVKDELLEIYNLVDNKDAKSRIAGLIDCNLYTRKDMYNLVKSVIDVDYSSVDEKISKL
jgi:hypothetical protein